MNARMHLIFYLNILMGNEMSNLLIRDPKIEDTTDIVDWLEARVLLENRGKVSRTRLRKYLHELVILEDDISALDIQVDLVLEEINRRKTIANGQYPFHLERSGFRVEETDQKIAYVFLLCLSTSLPFRDENRQNEVESLLDYLVIDALQNYLAGKSKGEHFGWPVTGDRPTNFSAAIAWLTKKMGLPMGIGKRRNYSKDCGVDAVVWRPFNDGRTSFIAILAQCTVTIDWFGKAKDIVPDVWDGWVDFGKNPVTCLAIPFIVPITYEKWDELRRTVNLVLDRLRICELLNGIEINKIEGITDWTLLELRKMNGLEVN